MGLTLKRTSYFLSVFFLFSSVSLFSETGSEFYHQRAQTAPDTESVPENMESDYEGDEIDKEIERYFGQIQNTSRIDYDESRLKDVLQKQSEQHAEDGMYSFSNIAPHAEAAIESAAPTTKSDPPRFQTHTVERGDTLWNISKKYDVPLETILKHNPELKKRVAYIGEEIILVNESDDIPVYVPEVIYHRVRSGDSFWSISHHYHIPTKTIYSLNGLNRKSVIHPGQILRLSKTKLDKRYIYRPFFYWPLKGRITSGFGRRRNPFARRYRQFHKGIDIAAPIGTKFTAPRDGVVIFSARFRGYGNCIFIRHTNGYVTVYGHNRMNLVQKGEIVHRGQVIGEVGRTGMATGPHLHFEIRKKTVPMNPRVVMNLKEAVARKVAYAGKERR